MKIIFTTLNEQEPSPSGEQPPAPTSPIIINSDQAKQLIKNSRGKIFTVTFVKRMDGTIRTMNARLGVKAYLKGGELPYDPEPKGLIPVFDIPKRAYRMINLNSIINLKIDNKEYQVKDSVIEGLTLDEILFSLRAK